MCRQGLHLEVIIIFATYLSFSECCCRGCLLWDNTHAISAICGDIGILCCSIYRRNYFEENNLICI